MSWKERGKWLGWLMNQEDHTEKAAIKQAQEIRLWEGREIFKGELKTLSPKVKKVCEQFSINVGGTLNAHEESFQIMLKARDEGGWFHSIEVHLNACFGFWTNIVTIKVGTQFYSDTFLTNLQEGKLFSQVYTNSYPRNVQNCKEWGSPYNPQHGFYREKYPYTFFNSDGKVHSEVSSFLFYLIPAEDFTEFRLMSLLEIFCEEALKRDAKKHLL